MIEPKIDRRSLIAASTAVVAGAAALSAATGTASAQGTAPSRMVYAPQPLALPFDPATIPGLSAKLLTSHHDNNYVGAVKRLQAISAQLAHLDPTAAPNFMVNGLKREELIAWNSMVLHEIYFSQFGTPGNPGKQLSAMITRDFGSEAAWRAEFSAMGKALGGGSGWVVLSFSHRDRRLVNQWAADHTMALAGSSPILILDMFEHAYAMDYGAKAAAYVDAVMAALDWRSADSRFAKANA